MMNLVEIDGSYLEGGGQILRNALSLSCILGRPVRITKIRANRPNPGLSNQHLYGLNLLQEICGAKVNGNFMKSTEVEFYPEHIKSGNFNLDTRTAASLTLVFQATLPVLLFGAKQTTLNLIGGTNVGMAPQVDFTTEVLRPNLERFGVSFDFDLHRRGYYPKGGGQCSFTVPPVAHITSADITTFGRLKEICGWAYVAGNLPSRLAKDMSTAAIKELETFGITPLIEPYKESSEMARDNGAGIVLKAVTSEDCTLGSSGLGEKRFDAFALGDKAAQELSNYIKQEICVDEHVQDQLIIFMALANGKSRIQTVELTNHTLTAIHVAEIMTGVKFEIEKNQNGHTLISCVGINFKNKNLIG